jgi:hypothetical protein
VSITVSLPLPREERAIVCSPNDPSYGEIVASAQRYKEQSLVNPDGVQYLDHMWEMIRDIDEPLQVVLRTRSLDFPDVPVRAFWRRYRYDFDNEDFTRYELLVDLPDEVYRRIQAQYASGVLARMFGIAASAELPQVFRRGDSDYDGKRHPRWKSEELTVIEDDWPLLKDAIRMTSGDGGSRLGGQSLGVLDRTGVLLARVREGRLELLLDEGFEQSCIRLWTEAFREALGMK